MVKNLQERQRLYFFVLFVSVLVETILSSSWPHQKIPVASPFLYILTSNSPSETQQLKKTSNVLAVVWVRLLSERSFFSQQNLPIANLKPNRTALSSQCQGLADSRRGKEGVLSCKPKLSFCAGTMPWLEQSHLSTFLPFWGGPCVSQCLSESFHCAICWVVICNAAMTEYKYTDFAEPLWFLQYGQLRSHSGGAGQQTRKNHSSWSIASWCFCSGGLYNSKIACVLQDFSVDLVFFKGPV